MANPIEVVGDPNDSKTAQILSVLLVSTILAYITYCMRMYVRVRMLKSVGWDDHTMSFAIVTCTIVLTFQCLAISNGIGRRRVTLTDEHALAAAKWETLTHTPHLLTIMATRSSLCLLMLRLVGPNRFMQVFLWIVIAGTIVTSLLACANTYIACVPWEKVWNPALTGSCDFERRGRISMTMSVWTIGSDWLVALFPVFLLRKSQMPMRTKVAVCVIMGLGVVVGIFALMKTLTIGGIYQRRDQTFDGVTAFTWILLEQNLGIVLVNVPATRPLFAKVFRLGSSKGTGNPTGYRLNDYAPPTFGGSRAPKSKITITAGRKGIEDNESESSLVMKGDGGIVKTVNFSQKFDDHASQQEKEKKSKTFLEV